MCRPVVIPITVADNISDRIMKSVNKFFLPLLLTTLVILLFVGGPGHYSNRIYRSVWDLGHILLFITFSVYLFELRYIRNKGLWQQLLLVFAVVIFFAIATELAQTGTSRTPELLDVRRDLVGALIGTVIIFTRRGIRGRIYPLFISAAMLLLMVELSPLAKILVDEYAILQSDTVLSNLEGMYEDTRWKGNSSYQLSTEHVVEGKQSLKVVFNTDYYSGITLKYMHRDWRGKDKLHVSVYNPDEDVFTANVRINDFPHLKENIYNDRYNKIIKLTKGWNHLVFSVDDIKNAPAERVNNIDNMQSIGIFVINLNVPKTIYIDNVYLD